MPNKEQIYIEACKFAIRKLKERGSAGYGVAMNIINSDDCIERVTASVQWNEVLEWLSSIEIEKEDDSLPGASRDIDELERKYGAEELPSILLNIKAEITLNKKGFPPSADYYKALTRCETIIDKHINKRE